MGRWECTTKRVTPAKMRRLQNGGGVRGDLEKSNQLWGRDERPNLEMERARTGGRSWGPSRKRLLKPAF